MADVFIMWARNLFTSVFQWITSAFTWVYSALHISPDTVSGGSVWNVVKAIYNGLTVAGTSLLVIVLYINIMKKAKTWVEVKHVGIWIPVFIEFVVFAAILNNGLAVMLWLIQLATALVDKIFAAGGYSSADGLSFSMTGDILNALNNLDTGESFLIWVFAIIALLVVIIMGVQFIVPVITRLFKFCFLTAISPIFIPLLAGESTRFTGISFIKTFFATAIEGAIIALTLIIYKSWGAVLNFNLFEGTESWDIIFNWLITQIIAFSILNTFIKGADQLAKELIR